MAGHAGEVLHEDARRPEGDLLSPTFLGSQSASAAMSSLRDGDAVLEAHQVLEQDPQREGQARDVAEAGALEGIEAVVCVGASADVEGRRGRRSC